VLDAVSYFVGPPGLRLRSHAMAGHLAGRTVRVVAGSLVLALGLGACGGSSGGDEPNRADRDRARRVEATTTTASDTTVPDGTSFVAQAKSASVPIYATAGAAKPSQSLDNPNENGAPLVFLVSERQGDWLNVYLPVRPNGSTGWVRAADVTVVANRYSVDITLGEHRLVVHDGQDVVLDEPIGVGTAQTPTPGGVYYIKELLQPPDPNGPYGPYAYGLSGFSNVLDEFKGGDGVIGIHGTNEPDAIGTDVSHGCIRMRNEAILELVPVLPLGTPVHITA
jgi:lipoprotein-anchoring transpeptidase ErfK/SrfK